MGDVILIICKFSRRNSLSQNLLPGSLYVCSSKGPMVCQRCSVAQRYDKIWGFFGRHILEQNQV